MNTYCFFVRFLFIFYLGSSLDENSKTVLGNKVNSMEFEETSRIQYYEEEPSYPEKAENYKSRRHSRSAIPERAQDEIQGNGGALIDHAVYDPDSAISEYLAGMFVKRNGVERSPYINYRLSAGFRAQEMDSHKLTHSQKIRLGLESEYEDEERKRRKKRNFVMEDQSLWPGGIVPYTQSSTLAPTTTAVIVSAISMMSNLTCIRFTPLGSSLANTVGHSNYVNFLSASGCWSYVGMINWGRQDLSLQESGCVNIGTAIHEMCHALGMWHEQNRQDRDPYIEIYDDNIQNGQNNVNFKKFNTRDNNPYDISSILQYYLGAFAIDTNKPTMRSKDPKLAFLAGKANGLMYYDVKDITVAYRCTDSCNNPPTCENGGFLNHNCGCYCPSGLIGSTCNTVQSSSGCGGIITLSSGVEQTITSPNYPNNYDTGVDCVWLIKAPSNEHVQLTIDFMDIADNGFDACYHWLEIRYNLLGQSGPELCGIRNAENYYTTSDELKNEMLIKFNSAVSSDRAPKKGFQLTVRSIGVSCVDSPCRFGKCVISGASYICECDSGYSGANCNEITDGSVSLSATFDDPGLTFLQNVQSDQFDWSVGSGPTVSSSTGPSAAQSGLYYMYIEASSPRSAGETAVMNTSIIDFLIAILRCLKFYYHMFGSTVGSLNVFYQGTNTPKTLAFSKSGNQGNSWHYAEIDIPAISNLQIIFEGIRGDSWSGDIAIDTIELLNTICAATTTTTTTTTEQKTTTTEPTTSTTEPTTSTTEPTTTTTEPTTTSAEPTTTTTELTTTSTEPTTSTTEPTTTTTEPTTTTTEPTTTTTEPTTTTTEPTTTTTQPTTTTTEPTTTTTQPTTTTTQPTTTTTEPTTTTTQPTTTSTEPTTTTTEPTTTTTEPTTTTTQPTTTTTQPTTTTTQPTTTTTEPTTTTTQPTTKTTEPTTTTTEPTTTTTEPTTTTTELTTTTTEPTTTTTQPTTTTTQPTTTTTEPTTTTTEPTTTTTEPTTTTTEPTTTTTEPTTTTTEPTTTTTQPTTTTTQPTTTTTQLTTTTTEPTTTSTEPTTTTTQPTTTEPTTTTTEPTTTSTEPTTTTTEPTTTTTDPTTTTTEPTTTTKEPTTTTTEPTTTTTEPTTTTTEPTTTTTEPTTTTTEPTTTTTQPTTTTTQPTTTTTEPTTTTTEPTTTTTEPTTTTTEPTTTTTEPTTTTTQPTTTTTEPTTTTTQPTTTTTQPTTTTTQPTTSTTESTTTTTQPTTTTTEPTTTTTEPTTTSTQPTTTTTQPTTTTTEPTTTSPEPTTTTTEPTTTTTQPTTTTTEPTTTTTQPTTTTTEPTTTTTQPTTTTTEPTTTTTEPTTTTTEPTTTTTEPTTSTTEPTTTTTEPTTTTTEPTTTTTEPTTTTTEPTTTTTEPTTTSTATTSTTPSMTTTTSGTTTTSIPTTVNCGFETTEDCFFENSQPSQRRKRTTSEILLADNFDWIFGKSGPTPSSRTGPSSAIEGVRYTYIEASSPRASGERAVIRTTNTFRATLQCISFYYHMYGSANGMGTLNVYYSSSSGHVQKIFTQSGNQGDQWLLTAVEIPPTNGLVIYIEGIRGRSYKSDIAIDAVTVTEGNCGCTANPCLNGGTCTSSGGGSGYSCLCASGYGGTNCDNIVGTATCTFTGGSCSFLVQSSHDSADWSFGTSTPSRYTGPQSPFDGTFAYIEASGKRWGTTYILTTTGTVFAQQTWCLSFVYNMYGRHMGTLQVNAGSSGSLSTLWYTSGNKGINWITQRVTIPSTANLVVDIKGIRGWGYRGDIALDNVTMTPGSC